MSLALEAGREDCGLFGPSQFEGCVPQDPWSVTEPSLKLARAEVGHVTSGDWGGRVVRRSQD